MGRLTRFAAKTVRFVRRNGLAYTLRRAWEMADERLLFRYDRAWKRAAPDAAELLRQRENQPDGGQISIAVPLYNTRPIFLRELADSLLKQTYQNWQAVLYDGASSDPRAIAAMNALPDDPRILLIHGDTNGGISANTNAAIAHCTGDYIALCDHDDALAPDAMWRVAEAIAARHPDMLYSDEDKLTENGRIHTDAHHKPDFCPDNLRSGNYICHLMVMRRALLHEVGGLRTAFDGSQDHDLALRLSERANGIVHIPRTLYHWRTVGSSESHQHLARCQDAAARAVTEHLKRTGLSGICTVEDGALRLRYDLKDAAVQLIRIGGEGRISAINRAAAESTADILLFADERIGEIPPIAMREMQMYAQRDDVGAVTAMLTDKRGRITHAGYALGKRIASRNRGLPHYAGGWHNLNRTVHNVSAVGSCCFMIRRDHFIPLDEGYRGEMAMADWSLRLAAQGYRHVYTPHAMLRCICPDPMADRSDVNRFRARWPELIDRCMQVQEQVW